MPQDEQTHLRKAVASMNLQNLFQKNRNLFQEINSAEFEFFTPYFKAFRGPRFHNTINGYTGAHFKLDFTTLKEANVKTGFPYFVPLDLFCYLSRSLGRSVRQYISQNVSQLTLAKQHATGCAVYTALFLRSGFWKGMSLFGLVMLQLQSIRLQTSPLKTSKVFMDGCRTLTSVDRKTKFH